MANRDKYLAEVFKQPPLIAYKRQPNLKGQLIRAKVPGAERPYPKRRLNGMKKCGENCTACPYILNKKSIKINGIDWKINQNLNCKSFNVVYAIICSKEKCNMIYIGETKTILKFRLDDHCGYVNCNIDCATGSHFTQAWAFLGKHEDNSIGTSKEK